MPYPYTKIKSRDDSCSEIETSKDYYLEVCGYCKCGWKRILHGSLVLFTFGFAWLVIRWKPVFGVWLTSRHCPLSVADTVVLKDNYGIYSVAKVQEQKLSRKSQIIEQSTHSAVEQNQELVLRYFIHKCIRYIWDNESCTFKQLRGYDIDVPCSDFTSKFHGLSELQQEEKIQIYGPNKTDVEVKSYFNLLINEVLNPFYIFQVASILLWMLDNYYYYASAIFVISVISICVSLYETRRQQISLRDMAGRFSSLEITVARGNGEYGDTSVNNLVPGDVIVIPPHGCHMTCDAVLIAGSCIVNESMLTGESVPETKIPLGKHSDDELYNSHLHKRHTLFSGTEIIQTRYYGSEKVLAVVIKTGFLTAKGELLCSMMFPRPLGFKFFNEAMRFVVLLFFISALGMAYSLYYYIQRGASVLVTVLRALDLVTIVVPPALPAALTVGTVYAQSRLKKQGIFCISQPHINVAGRINLMCFDKTGTLTSEGLDLWGIIPVDDRSFRPAVHEPSLLPVDSRYIAAMATCHSLTIIDGELTGDPLDLKMFLATEWRLEEPGSDNTKYDMLPPTIVYPPKTKLNERLHEIGIIRQFPFSSSLQRMSVVCRSLGADHMDLYSKGAPEKIASLCLPNTVPEDFEIFLQNYTLKGFRVIALAWRSLEPKLSWHHVHRSKRSELEKDMVFLGFLIMQNMLKPETLPIIGCLKKASVRCVMVTGDNLLTALSVARECGMVPLNERIILTTAYGPDHQTPAKIKWEYAESSPPGLICDMSSSYDNNSTVELYQTIYMEENSHFHFAVDGKAFTILHDYFPEMIPKIVVRGTVFARMLPEQKTQLVEALQGVGYVVGMCGDGANDCGALKAADVGISLSDAEASVAAPFTSKVQNIECVPKVIKEGRCALVTAIAVFKFISLYSIIQFTSVLIIYTVGTNLGDQMFLYIDLPIITTLAIVMSNTKAYEKLVPERPQGTLINVTSITSLFLQICLVIGGQAAVLIYLQSREWYRPISYTKDEVVVACWENSSIFLFTCYQYIAASVVFSRGPPYRKAFFTNVYFVAALIILIAFSTFLLFNPFTKLADFFKIVHWQPNEHFYFRLTLLLMAGCSFIFSLMIEALFAESIWLKQIMKTLKRNSVSGNEYERIEEDIRSNRCWPNVEEPVYAIGPPHPVSL